MRDVREVYRGRRFRIEERTLPVEGGDPQVKEVVVHPGAAVILPLLDDEHVVLVRNYRPALGETLLELPAGTLEPPESAAACAARELEEEAGYRAASLDALVQFYSSPGFCTERMHVFLARGLSPVPPHPDPGERVEPVLLRLKEAVARIARGEVRDAKTIAALLYYERFGAGEGA
jgi:ADP-ribose pyrophosphatase